MNRPIDMAVVSRGIHGKQPPFVLLNEEKTPCWHQMAVKSMVLAVVCNLKSVV